MRLVAHYSKSLEKHIQNSQIGYKEVIAAVMALTFEEPLLRLLIDKPKYLFTDNTVLVGLLEQLEDSSHIANYFLAHPDFRAGWRNFTFL